MSIETKIVDFIKNNIKAQMKSISIIGSYVLERRVKSGSDIDVVVVVNSLNDISMKFDNLFYKQPRKIVDPQGERVELNVKMDNTVLDITVIDSFNEPNNPLVDFYENHIGWCTNALCIDGDPMKTIFNLEARLIEYDKIHQMRLDLVNEKIAMTKRKITKQRRFDLHIIYELQKYVFIREVIKRHKFNRQSIKHPEDVIPNFDQLFFDEIKRDCGLTVAIKVD